MADATGTADTADAKNALDLGWKAMLLIAVPIAAFIAGDLLLHTMAYQGSWNHIPISDFTDRRLESASRIYMVTAFAVLMATCILVTATFFIDLAQLFSRSARWTMLTGAVIGAAIMGLWFSQASSWISRPVDQLGPGYVAQVIEHNANIEECIPRPSANRYADPAHKVLVARGLFCRRHNPSLLQRFQTLTDITTPAVLIALASVIVGAISCLGVPTPNDRPGQAAATLALQRTRLRRYLNGSALMLAVSLVCQTIWMRWLIIPYGNAAGSHGLSAQIDAIGIFFGVYYSLVIASYIVPVWTILGPAEPVDGTATPGVPVDILDRLTVASLGKALTILAPALASVLATLPDLFK